MFFILCALSIALAKKYNVILENPTFDGVYANSFNDDIFQLLDEKDKVLKKTHFGYTLDLSEKTMRKLEKHPRIIHIEEDQEVKIATYKTFDKFMNNYQYKLGNNYKDPLGFMDREKKIHFMLQKNTPWGLSRISGQVSGYEYISKSGKGVTVYVLDTGVDDRHQEFEGRAKMKYNFVENSPYNDEHGHGTHCAGVIGAKTYGIAKQARIVGIKVLDRKGFGSISRLIEGINAVVEDHLEERSMDPFRTAVVNMSIGGRKSKVLNHIVEYVSRMYKIHFATAAGNDGDDACDFSPSSSSTALTVGALNMMNQITNFSNQGACVDIYAPGVKILSTWPGQEARLATGTSMATPHVAGIMAVYLGLADFTPEELKKRIMLDSEKTAIGERRWVFFTKKERLVSLENLYNRLKRSMNQSN
ncbi:proteinase B [Glugoides intestinalis]